MHLETIREVGASMTKYVYPTKLLVRYLWYGYGNTGYNNTHIKTIHTCVLW